MALSKSGYDTSGMAGSQLDQAGWDQYNPTTGQWNGVDPGSFKFDPNALTSFNQQAAQAGVSQNNLNPFAQQWRKAEDQRNSATGGAAPPPPGAAGPPPPAAGPSADVGAGGMDAGGAAPPVAAPTPTAAPAMQGLQTAADQGPGYQEISASGIRQGLGTRLTPSMSMAGLKRAAY